MECRKSPSGVSIEFRSREGLITGAILPGPLKKAGRLVGRWAELIPIGQVNRFSPFTTYRYGKRRREHQLEIDGQDGRGEISSATWLLVGTHYIRLSHGRVLY